MRDDGRAVSNGSPEGNNGGGGLCVSVLCLCFRWNESDLGVLWAGGIHLLLDRRLLFGAFPCLGSAGSGRGFLRFAVPGG